MQTVKSVLRNKRSGMEPHLKKLGFFLLLTFLILAASNATTNDMEVYIDVSLHLNLNLSTTLLALGELDEAGEEASIGINIRANTKSWKISAKPTYASLTWGADPGGTWIAPSSGTLIQIPYRVLFADNIPYQVLFPLAALPANVDTTLYSFTRKTDGGTNGEDFTFTVHVDPKGISDVWQSGEYQDTIMLTVTAL